MQIDANTRLYAVIGDPVSHTLSPAIHNAAFQALGLNCVYLAFQVKNVKEALGGLRSLGNFTGLSVTVPHKRAVIEHLDEVEKEAKLVGSVNTIMKREGKLWGSTSDGPAALRALEEAGIRPEGESVLFLGSGGVARAISFSLALARKPEELVIMGIVPPEVEELARDLSQATGVKVRGVGLSEDTLREEVGKAGLLIQCTPVGMHPRINEALVPRELLRPELTVFDVVYRPLRTRLLREAEETGCRTLPGLDMFLYQAVIQFELWTGKKAPLAVMREVLEKHLG